MQFVETWSGTSKFTGELVLARLEAEGVAAQLMASSASEIAPHHTVAPQWVVMVPADQLHEAQQIAPDPGTAEATPLAGSSRVVGWFLFAAVLGLPALVLVIRALS